MAGQRIIDPSNPESVARMLKRIDTLEQGLARLRTQHRHLSKKFDELSDFALSASSNLQFTAVDATHVSYSTGFVTDNKGFTYQVAGASIALPASTAVNLYAFFSPAHLTVQFVTDSSLQDALKKKSQIYVAGVRFAGFAAPKPATSSIYPIGSTFGLA